MVPEIADPKIPLKTSYNLEETQKAPPAKRGMSGRVKFVRLKNDPIPGRLFAIKRPTRSVAEMIGASTSEKRNKVALKAYENNVKIAKIIGDHDNFMKVHGIVIKDIKKGKESKPFLILEHIEATTLRDLPQLTSAQKVNLLNQLKVAFTHMYERNIFPVDLNFGNFLVTKDHQLKLIDYDHWESGSGISPERLGGELYRIAGVVAKKIGGAEGEAGVNVATKNDFMLAMDDLIARTQASG